MPKTRMLSTTDAGRENVAASFPVEQVHLIEEVCAKRGETKSHFVRNAILEKLARLHYLPPEMEKLLDAD